MPFVFEQPNLDNESESHLYFDPGDGRLITVLHERGARADPGARRRPGCVHHIAFSLSQATFAQVVERLDERGIRHSGVKDRGFMDSIYFDDPLGLLIELASYRFEPPFGLTTADVLLEAHRLRVERGDYNIDRDAPRRRDRGARPRSRASLSDDRSPKNPYRRRIHGREHAQRPEAEREQPDRADLRPRRRARLRGGRRVGQDATPEFLAKDPAHLTPLLEEDGLPRGSLWESCAIMQYLCNKHGLDRFYPTDPGERAMVDSAMFYLIGTLYPLLARATYPALGFPQYPGEVGTSDADDAIKAQASRTPRPRSPSRSTSTARSSSTAAFIGGDRRRSRHPARGDARVPARDRLRLPVLDARVPGCGRGVRSASLTRRRPSDVRGYIEHVRSQPA
jgi:hypothetical protein